MDEGHYKWQGQNSQIGMLEKNKVTNNICHLRQLGETLSSGGQVSNCETAAEMNRALLKKRRWQ